MSVSLTVFPEMVWHGMFVCAREFDVYSGGFRCILIFRPLSCCFGSIILFSMLGRETCLAHFKYFPLIFIFRARL